MSAIKPCPRPEASTARLPIGDDTGEQLTTRDPNDLKDHPFNPRGAITKESVADLILSVGSDEGIIEPLIILPDNTVVVGHRRKHAAIYAGLTKVPVIVRNYPLKTQLRIMIIENIERRELNPLEEARGYQQLASNDYSISDIVREVHKKAVRIRAHLAILDLAPEIQTLFAERRIPLMAALELLKLSDNADRTRIALFASTRHLSCEKVSREIKHLLNRESRSTPNRGRYELKSVSNVCRDSLLQRIELTPESTVKFSDLHRIFKATCCECGLDINPQKASELCNECPLSEFVAALTNLGTESAENQ